MTHDFALLCTVAKEILGASSKKEDQRRTLKDIISQCRKLNDARVRVVHGLWEPSAEGGTVHHATRSNLKETINVKQASELETQALQANHLRSLLDDLMWDVRSALPE